MKHLKSGKFDLGGNVMEKYQSKTFTAAAKAVDHCTIKKVFADLERERYGDEFIALEPLSYYSFKVEDWRIKDEMTETGPIFMGKVVLCYKGCEVWSAEYTGCLDHDFEKQISLCLKQAKSFPNPELPIFGPSMHKSCNGFFYHSVFDGDLNNFYGAEHIVTPERDNCVFRIDYQGGWAT